MTKAASRAERLALTYINHAMFMGSSAFRGVSIAFREENFMDRFKSERETHKVIELVRKILGSNKRDYVLWHCLYFADDKLSIQLTDISQIDHITLEAYIKEIIERDDGFENAVGYSWVAMTSDKFKDIDDNVALKLFDTYRVNDRDTWLNNVEVFHRERMRAAVVFGAQHK